MSSDVSAQGDLEWLVSRTCESGACVGVARRGESVLIRNTNDPNGIVTEFSPEEWRQFLIGAKLGDFDGIA
jgi:Domain of unknown function (DUF397)